MRLTRSGPVAVLWLSLASIGLTGCGSYWENDPPEILRLLVNGRELAPDEVLEVTPKSAVVFACFARDPETDMLMYTWTLAPSDASTQEPDPKKPPDNIKEWTAPEAEGEYTVTCSVSDDRGGVTSERILIRVTDPGINDPPRATLEPTAVILTPGATEVFVCTATDLDDDPLSYTFLAGDGSLTPDPSEPNKATYTAPLDPGKYAVYCIVTDGRGSYVAVVAEVTVESAPTT